MRGTRRASPWTGNNAPTGGVILPSSSWCPVPQGFIPYQPERFDADDETSRAEAFRDWMDGRRSVRMFDPTRDVSKETIAAILETAGTAPSGAHKQPWTFVAIRSAELKQKIRAATEEQEKRFYDELITDEWRRDLEPLGTDFVKTHLTDAPWVIVVFSHDYELGDNEEKLKNYYVTESVGIACGFLLAAIRQAGLCSLTHTPSPMTYLRDLLGRPSNERTFLVVPVGHAHPDCTVPDLRRKTLDEFVVWKD